MKNILCPIDFTTFSHHALRRAAEMARAYGSAVTGIYVAEAHLPVGAEAARTDWTNDELARMQAQVLKALQEVGAPSPRAVAVAGTAALEIVKLATSLPADLIVMPAHGRTGCAEGACGSVTHHILCHAPAPVLVIPDAPDSEGEASNGAFHRILCGVNFSPASLKALRYAGDLAGVNSANLLVAHVRRTDEASPATADDSDVWRRRLHEATHSDMRPGLHVDDRLKVGDPAAELLHLANDERCDLIVIGGHRGNPPACVMNEIVMRSHCPVLTLRVAR